MFSIDLIVGIMQPNFEEFADDTQFQYWMDYACELDEILYNSTGDVVEYLNERMSNLLSSKPEHHACVDVATTLESLSDSYKGKFKYS